MSPPRLHIPHRQPRTFHHLAPSFQHYLNSLSSVPRIKKAAAVASLKVSPSSSSSLIFRRLLTSQAFPKTLSQSFLRPSTTALLHHRLRPNIIPTLITPRTSFSTSSPKMVSAITNKSSFDADVQGAAENKLVVLDCYATWCGPCKVMSPIIEQYAKSYPAATFFKMDVDEASDVAQELGIRAMPTFLLFKNGEKIDEVVGANPAGLKAKIEKNL